MPKRAPMPCRTQRCPKVVDSRIGYCDIHLEEHNRSQKGRHRRYNQARSLDPGEAKLARFYQTAAWHKIRTAYMSQSPLCEHCTLRNRVVVGTMVDHIEERRDGGADLDMSNLQTLCHRCHSTKTAEERRRRHGNKDK